MDDRKFVNILSKHQNTIAQNKHRAYNSRQTQNASTIDILSSFYATILVAVYFQQDIRIYVLFFILSFVDKVTAKMFFNISDRLFLNESVPSNINFYFYFSNFIFHFLSQHNCTFIVQFIYIETMHYWRIIWL